MSPPPTALLRALSLLAAILCVSGLPAQIITWNSGDILTLIALGNPPTVDASETLVIDTTGLHDFNAKAVTNNGTVSWLAGPLRSGGSGSLTNNAAFNDSATNEMNNDYTGGWAFHNTASGVYTKSSGATIIQPGVAFNNQGLINVTGGTLTLSGGGNLGGGTIQASVGATVNLASAFTGAGTITFAGAGDIRFTGSLAAGSTLQGPLNWVSGNFNGVGTTTFGSGATITATTTGLHDFNQRALVNNGTFNWTTGPLRSGGSASFTNNATFNDTATNQMNNDFTGGWAFNNAPTGVYLKASGTTTVLPGVTFNNQGLIDVTGGTLTLQGGGNLAGGTIQAASGTTVNLASAFTGTGTITFAGAGDIRLTGSLAAGSTLQGPLNWVSGLLNGTGTTTFGSGAIVTATLGDHDFNQRTVVNDGTFNWTAGPMRAGGSALFRNNAVFNDTATNQMNNAYTGGWTFLNPAGGTYNKTSGTTTVVSGVSFNNAGLVQVSNSTLTLQGGGNLTGGTLHAGTGGLIDLASSFVVNGTTTFSGPGEVRLSAGTMTGASILEGPLNWFAGNFNGVGTTTFGETSVINVLTTGLHDFNQRQLVNEGTVNWSAGPIRSGGSGSFTNNAAFNDTATNELNNDYTGGWAFNNSATGTYTKTAGTTLVAPGVSFNNAGLVQVSNATLTLQGGGNLAGGTLAAGTGGTIVLASSFNNPGVVTLAGPGEIRFTTGTMSGLTTFEGPLTWEAGNFNGPGTTTFGSTAIVQITTTGLHDFNQRALVNHGTINWLQGPIRAGGSASFTNHGDFIDAATNELNNDYTGGWTFHNTAAGLYHKTTGATVVTSGVAFNNSGQVNLTGNSTLTLQGGGNLAGGTIDVAAGSTLNLASSFNSPGVVTFAGAGDIRYTAGTWASGTTFEGPFNWVSGSFNGTGTTTFGATADVTITSTSLHDLNQRAIVNHGSITWLDGQIRAGGSASFANFGTFTDAGLTDQFNNAYTGGWTFTNKASGLYRKAGTGVTTVAAGVAFVNEGTLALEHGTLAVQGGLTLQATSELLWVLSGPATDTGYGLLSVSTALALNGTLDLKFGSGFDTATSFAATHTLLTASSLSGAFGNVASGSRLVSSDGLGSYVVHYGAGSPFGANSVVITGFVSVPEPSTWALIILGLGAVGVSAHRRRRH